MNGNSYISIPNYTKENVEEMVEDIVDNKVDFEKLDFNKISSSEEELDFEISESDEESNNLLEWWTNSHKVVITDDDTKARFEVALEKMDDTEGFNLFQKNKQCVGRAIPWFDKENIIPSDFKHKNIVQDPETFGIPLYVYELFSETHAQLYHDLPKKIYRKYRFYSDNNFMKITNEILEKF